MLILLAPGCEKVNVLENNIVFEEYLVIRAELPSGKFFDGVRITKTLPFDVEYTIKKAEIKDANAYLRINYLQIIPLHYSDSALYTTLNNFKIIAGTTYELFVELGSKKFYAITKAPQLPTIEKTSYYNDSVLQISVIPKINEVYGGIWNIIAGGTDIIAAANDYNNLYQDINPTGYTGINVLTKEIPREYRNVYYRTMLYAQVFAYDKPYMDYYKSKNNNQVIENIFAQGGGPVSWNVYGDKVIGLFIGSAASNPIKIVK